MEATSRRWRGSSTPSSRCSYEDDVASIAWGVRNLIFTQVAAEKIPGSVPILAKLGFAGDYAGTMPSNPLPSTMDLSMVM